MATYVIGDIQGCLDQLQALLDLIHFNPNTDKLCFLGDIVNRGPKSLETLRFIRQLEQSAITLLGNHDLHLIACFHDRTLFEKEDTIQEIVSAPDAKELIDWLRFSPVMHFEASFQTILIHAGIAPNWTVATLFKLTKELEQVLQSDNYVDYIDVMYGDTPCLWDEQLKGHDRYRFITNVLTRLRFCDEKNNLLLKLKVTPEKAPKEALPWFTRLDASFKDYSICFGHWAALDGHSEKNNIHALDTGCVWGGKLTAFRLEDKKQFQVAGLV